MAKNKRSNLSKVTKRAAKKSRKRSNPSKTGVLAAIGMGDIASQAGVAVGSYAVTRLAGRIGYSLVKKKSPKWAKHAGPWSSAAVALAATVYSQNSNRLDKYEAPIIMGAWIAALQGLLQTYFPRWGWILNDYHMDDMPALTDPTTGKTRSRSNGSRRSTVDVPGFDSSKPEDMLEGDDMEDITDPSGDDFADIPGLGGGSSMSSGIFSGGL